MSGVTRKLLATTSDAPTDEFFNSVSLLVHGDGADGSQNNTFIDSSINNFTINRFGNATQGSFSPFGSIGGASGFFDGVGDYLLLTGNALQFGSNDTLTIEFFAYKIANQATTNTIFAVNATVAGNPRWSFFWQGAARGFAVFNTASSTYLTGPELQLNQWHHYAFVKQGSQTSLYSNGVLAQSSTNTVSSQGTLIGVGATGIGGENFPGFISNVRVVKGAALYTSNFTPPTAPLSAVGNTSILLSFANAAIFDSASKNILETVGNAKIDTSIVKYGTGSMEFDGSGDYVVQPTNSSYGYGVADFSIEFWLYLNSTSTQTLVSNLSSASSTNPNIYINSSIRYSTTGVDRIVGAALSTGQWYHIAVCRESGFTRLFVDGIQSGSTYLDSNNYGSSAPLGIGTYWSSGSPVTSSTLNGYIDDLRITKGVARYTETFTPPNRAFPDQ